MYCVIKCWQKLVNGVVLDIVNDKYLVSFVAFFIYYIMIHSHNIFIEVKIAVVEFAVYSLSHVTFHGSFKN